MKKNYYAKVLALTVAASMVSVPAFAEETEVATPTPTETEGEAVTLPLLNEERSVVVAEEETKNNTVKFFAASDNDTINSNTSGFCGDPAVNEGKDVQWNFDAETGTLTISGSGKMADYSVYDETTGQDKDAGIDPAPWKNLPIVKVVVEEGVTSVGNRAFYDMQKLKYAEISSTVESLGLRAFNWSESLESITFADNSRLKEICFAALSNVHQIKILRIPAAVTNINDWAIANNNELTEIIFNGNNLKKIGYAGIKNNPKLSKVILPEGLTKIGGYGLGENPNLIAFVPSTVIEMSDQCFTESTKMIYFKSNETYEKYISVSRPTKLHAVTDGGTFPADTVFVAGKLATPVREGYIFDGWYEKDADGDFAGNAVATPEAGKTYYAKWILAKPAICVDGTATKVYDGEEVTLSVPAVDNATYTWKKGETNVGTSNTLKLKDVADSGSYTCTITVGEESETSDAVVVSITKAPITLTSDRQSMKGAGTVTLTVNGIAENEKNSIAVTCDDTSVNVNDSNGTYTAYLPNATKTYTFTATGTNSNYEWKDNSCTVSVSRKKSSSSSDTSAPTYGVSTGKTENGTISVTPAKAEAGEKVTIKATPDSGYQLDKVTVKDKDNSNVKLTKVNDNEYTFTMPKGKVSVDATFVQKDAADDNQNSAAEKSKVIKLQIGSRIVNVDNEAVIYDAAPVIRNDRTLIPIRIVTETLGGKVDWNGITKEVTLNIDGKEIKMTVGKTLEKYGVAPVIIDGRTFVPVRFVADELGATVAWDDATKTVTITKIEK